MSLMSNGQIFYVNSKNRNEGTSSNFSYNFKFASDKKYNRCVVLQLTLPKSYYLITSNESFILTEGDHVTSILINSGNYTRKSFAYTLALTLTNSSQIGATYTVTYDTLSTSADTGKFTYNVSGNALIQPSFTFLSTNDTNTHLGFNDSSINTFIGNTLVAPNVMNLQRESAIYLHSDLVTNVTDNILQEVFSNNSADYGSIVFNQYNIEGYSKVMTGNTNNTYRFYLTDENDNPIQLNGLNFNFTLLMYTRNNVYDKIKSFLQLEGSK